MKPFDLEKALAGESVVTRYGFKVLELHLFKYEINFPLIGLVFVSNDRIYTTTWTKEGKNDDFANDLFMDDSPKKKKYCICILKNKHGKLVASEIYEKNLSNCIVIKELTTGEIIKTIEFEIEE